MTTRLMTTKTPLCLIISLAAVFASAVKADGSAGASAQPSQPGEKVVRTTQALATSCGNSANPNVPGGQAHWDVSCQNGKITVSGWVKDTDADHRCAKVKAVFDSNNVKYSAAACPKNVTRQFSLTAPGHTAHVYLYVYDAS